MVAMHRGMAWSDSSSNNSSRSAVFSRLPRVSGDQFPSGGSPSHRSFQTGVSDLFEGDDSMSNGGSDLEGNAGPSSDLKRYQWSLGSAQHEAGLCQPCLFALTKVGCRNGSSCDFCHLGHKRKHKPRPCKGKRDRYRKLLARIESVIDANPNVEVADTLQNLPPSVEANLELKAKLTARVNKHYQLVRELHGIPTAQDNLQPRQASARHSRTGKPAQARDYGGAAGFLPDPMCYGYPDIRSASAAEAASSSRAQRSTASSSSAAPSGLNKNL